MRAGSPVLSAGRRRRRTIVALSPTCRSPRCCLQSFSRNKSPSAVEETPQVPVLLLRDMNLCYRLLRRLVPGLPPGRAASRVEILQHVIDYILDLQNELDASCPATERAEPPRGGEIHRDSLQSPGADSYTCQPSESLRSGSIAEERQTPV